MVLSESITTLALEVALFTPDHEKNSYSELGVAFILTVSPSSNCPDSGETEPPSGGFADTFRE